MLTLFKVKVMQIVSLLQLPLRTHSVLTLQLDDTDLLVLLLHHGAKKKSQALPI
jgi:hypothetical protein